MDRRVRRPFANLREGEARATDALLSGDREAAKLLAEKDEVVGHTYRDVEHQTLELLTDRSLDEDSLHFLIAVLGKRPEPSAVNHHADRRVRCTRCTAEPAGLTRAGNLVRHPGGAVSGSDGPRCARRLPPGCRQPSDRRAPLPRFGHRLVRAGCQPRGRRVGVDASSGKVAEQRGDHVVGPSGAGAGTVGPRPGRENGRPPRHRTRGPEVGHRWYPGARGARRPDRVRQLLLFPFATRRGVEQSGSSSGS